MTRLPRRQFLAAAGVTAFAGCNSATTTGGGDATPTETTSATATATSTGTEPTAPDSSLPTAEERLPLPLSPEELRAEAVSGGPPKDGIPSIDRPKFVTADEVSYLDPGDPVFGVARNGATKAYPQKILVQHEIVNDELGGTPVAVTYCPLTGTVQGFERGATTFGVSGRLINANLVMYDRETEAWWPQILATAIPGPWNEGPEIRSLREFRLVWTTWDHWRSRHPETEVLSTKTGHARNYSRDFYGSYNPRGGYYEQEDLLFPALHSDDRYGTKTVVFGARTPAGAVAFLKDAVLEKHVLAGELAGTPVVAVHDPRYETAYVYRNPDEVDLEFDEGSIVTSDGARHAPDQVPLSRIVTFDAMWFAWAGYYPETNVYE
jgi:hypothetical protein